MPLFSNSVIERESCDLFSLTRLSKKGAGRPKDERIRSIFNKIKKLLTNYGSPS